MCVTQIGRIVETAADGRALVADPGGELHHVSLAPLTLAGEPVGTGDWVLVHTGFAVERVPASDAALLIASLTDLEDGAHR